MATLVVILGLVVFAFAYHASQGAKQARAKEADRRQWRQLDRDEKGE